MSFGENISTLHASDLESGGRVSPRRESRDERQETQYLRQENEHLRLCLMLMKEHAELESANLISSVIAWCDDRFRRKFADMSLSGTTTAPAASTQGAISPFRPISPPSIAKRILENASTSLLKDPTITSQTAGRSSAGSPLSVSQLGNKSPLEHSKFNSYNQTQFSNSPLSVSQLGSRPMPDQTQFNSYNRSQSPNSPLSVSQLGSRPMPDQSHFSSYNQTKSPNSKSPHYGAQGSRVSPTGSSKYQSSGRGTMSHEGSSVPAPTSFSVDGGPSFNSTGRNSTEDRGYGADTSRPSYGSSSGRPASPSSNTSDARNGNSGSNPMQYTSVSNNNPPPPYSASNSSHAHYSGYTSSSRGQAEGFGERSTSPLSFNNNFDRPSAFSIQTRPKSPVSTIQERPPTPRTSFYSEYNASPTVASNPSFRPASPQTGQRSQTDPSNSSYLPRSPGNGFGMVNASSVNPTYSRATAPPMSPRPPSPGQTPMPPSPPRQAPRSTSPISFSQQPVQRNILKSPIQDSVLDQSQDVSQHMQYNAYGNPSVKFPTEKDVMAAYNSPFRANFSATIETQDLTTTLPTFNRPESSAFIPSMVEPSLQAQKVHPPNGPPSMSQTPHRSYTSQMSSATPSQNGTILARSPNRQDYKSIPEQTTFQEYSTVQGIQPSYSTQPSYQSRGGAGKEFAGEERSLTPFPEMQTKALPNNMISIREEMENNLRSGSPSPVNINKYTDKLFGQPIAASTPKKARTKSPTTSKGRKSPLKPKRSRSPSPTPRGQATPSPLSDDSFKAQNRRSVTNVKPSHRILGEIAFQLERRILDYVFARQKSGENKERNRRRFYGYTVSNIDAMIQKECRRFDGTTDGQVEFQLNYRLKYVLLSLRPFGFDLNHHGLFGQEMINKYGLLSNAPDRKTLEAFGLSDANTLREYVTRLSGNETEKGDVLILLECLFVMANDDGRAIFLW